MPTQQEIDSAKQSMQQGFMTKEEFNIKYGGTTPQTQPSQTGTPTTVNNSLTPEQRDKMYAQLESMNISPANVGSQNEKTLLESTFTPQELANMPYYAQISKREDQRIELSEGLTGGGIPKPSATMMRPLEEALKTKVGMAKESLGESELFAQSGIDPYQALSYSLSEKSKEMGDKYNSFASTLGEVSESLSDSYNQALTNYQILQGQYDTEVARIDSLTSDIRDHEFVLEEINAREASNKRIAEFTSKLKGEDMPSVSEQLKASEAGKVIINGMLYDEGSLQDVFNRKYASDYDTFGGATGKAHCGEAANDITNGSKVGDTWASKKKTIDSNITTPTIGNQIQIPLSSNGHTLTVLGHSLAGEFTPAELGVQVGSGEWDTVSVVEWNGDGQGTMQFNTYSKDDLNKFGELGTDWGFSDTTLKPEYQKKLDQVGVQDTGESDEIAYILENTTGIEQMAESIEDNGLTSEAAQKGLIKKMVKNEDKIDLSDNQLDLIYTKVKQYL